MYFHSHRTFQGNCHFYNGPAIFRCPFSASRVRMRSTCYDVQPFSYPSQPIRTPYAGIYVSPCAYTVFVRRSLIRCYNIARGICCVLNYSHYLLRISSKLLCTDRNCSSYRYSSFFHFFSTHWDSMKLFFTRSVYFFELSKNNVFFCTQKTVRPEQNNFFRCS